MALSGDDRVRLAFLPLRILKFFVDDSVTIVMERGGPQEIRVSWKACPKPSRACEGEKTQMVDNEINRTKHCP